VKLVVDLFKPPEPVRFRERVIALRAAKLTERQAAEQLGITITNAQRAADLQRQMMAQGIADPYFPVTSPPDDYAKLRRHKHPRYQFRPHPDWDSARS
jgi:hypothetical protein